MKVYINLLSYYKPEIEVEPTTTISAMKQKFQNAIGIPKENFIFKFNGETLEDAMTLTHYNIPDDGLLDIEGRLLATLHPRYVNMCNMDNMLSKLAGL
jgi:hypothetical protein